MNFISASPAMALLKAANIDPMSGLVTAQGMAGSEFNKTLGPPETAPETAPAANMPEDLNNVSNDRAYNLMRGSTQEIYPDPTTGGGYQMMPDGTKNPIDPELFAKLTNQAEEAARIPQPAPTKENPVENDAATALTPDDAVEPTAPIPGAEPTPETGAYELADEPSPVEETTPEAATPPLAGQPTGALPPATVAQMSEQLEASVKAFTNAYNKEIGLFNRTIPSIRSHLKKLSQGAANAWPVPESIMQPMSDLTNRLNAVVQDQNQDIQAVREIGVMVENMGKLLNVKPRATAPQKPAAPTAPQGMGDRMKNWVSDMWSGGQPQTAPAPNRPASNKRPILTARSGSAQQLLDR